MRHRQRRHHYVPQFYLAGFTDSTSTYRRPRLWVADTKTRQVREASPRDVAQRTQFYDWQRAASWSRSSVEARSLEELLRYFEDQAAPVLKRLAEQDLKRVSLSDKDRFHFSNFVGLQLARTPLALEVARAAQAESFADHVQRLAESPDFQRLWQAFAESRLDKGTLPPADEVRSRLRTRPPTLREHRDRTLALSLRAGMEMARYLFAMRWLYLVGEQPDVFFTSDHPVYLHTSESETEVSLALSSRLRLVACNVPLATRSNIFRLNAAGVEVCNRLVLQAVERLFFCPRRSLAEWTLEQYADAETRSIVRTLMGQR